MHSRSLRAETSTETAGQRNLVGLPTEIVDRPSGLASGTLPATTVGRPNRAHGAGDHATLAGRHRLARRRRDTHLAVEHAITERADAPPWKRVVKRSVDVIGAIVGLVALAPVLGIVALLIRADTPGRVIFAHVRMGRRGVPFQCYKLRTMFEDAEAQLVADEYLHAQHRANGFKLPSHVDHRVTRLGRVLRMTSLDEVPQFWNVLRGDMSLVGPRPVVADELGHFGNDRALLLSVRPGLTGAWAVGGRSRVSYPERAHIELDYVRSWSLRRDLAILARTVRVVLQRRGAY